MDVKANDLDLERNGEIRYSVQDSLGLLKINEQDGSLFADLTKLNSNLANISNLPKKLIEVNLEARDLGVPTMSTSSLNFTLYFNYELHEMPSEIVQIIENGLRSMDDQDKLSSEDLESEFLDSVICFFLLISTLVDIPLTLMKKTSLWKA